MYYAVTWREVPANPDCPPYQRGPFLVQRRKNHLLWISGGYMDWPLNAKILKVYRQRSADKALLAFYADHPPEKSNPCFSAGWLAPNGDFYTCDSWGHDGLAIKITAVLYKSLRGSTMLLRSGWCRIYLNGTVGYEDSELTQAQLDVLFDLSELPEGTAEWKRWISLKLR